MGPWCPKTPPSPLLLLVLGPLAPAGLPAAGVFSLLFCPLSIRSACFCAERVPRVFFFFHSPSFHTYSGGGLSHHARPALLSGRVLPRSAATSRLLCGRPTATGRVALCCLALVPRSYAFPALPRIGWVLRVLTPGLVLPALVLVPLLAVLLPGLLLPAPMLVFLLGGFPPVPRPAMVSIPTFFVVPVLSGRGVGEGRFHPLPGE